MVAFGGATRWMADPSVDLISLRRETAAISEDERKAAPPSARPREGADTVDGTTLADPAALSAAVTPTSREPKELDGAIARLDVEPDTWVTAGIAPRLHALIQGSDIYRPLTREQGINAVRFASADQVTASGVIWDANRLQLAFKPFMTVENRGRGFIVAFTGDPTYRGMADGLDQLLLNAVLQTSARARPTR